MKGGVALSAIGYIQVRAYTSYAQLPIKDAAVTIMELDGATVALRLTNRSGTLDEAVPITVPDFSASQTPNTGIIPYATVNLYAKAENYEEIEVENLQVFAGTVTVQDLEMIPLSEFPGQWNSAESFETNTQNL